MPYDLALPVMFHPDPPRVLPGGPKNPNAYYADEPTFQTITAGDFVGDVARGGSVNYRRVCLTPHGNGTHTECYGHISADPHGTLDRCYRPGLRRAYLVSVMPGPTRPPFEGECVTLESLVAAMGADLKGIEALVIRTLPNPREKMTMRYSGTDPAYLDPAIAYWLVGQRIEHLVVDLPSVDPERDGGALHVHRAFWGVDDTGQASRPQATITELAFIPDEVPDGLYFLELGVPHWRQDAAPSRPLLYTAQELNGLIA